MKQAHIITWLGGRKFIVAQELLIIATVASIMDKMNPMLAGILAAVGVAYGAYNVGSKFAGGSK